MPKTEAEFEAWEFAKTSGMNLITVCPTLVLGPMLQCTTNASSLVLVKLLKERYKQLENKTRVVVDVRDVAEALLMVYERPEAEGRYICTAHMIDTQDLVEMPSRFYPDHSYPKNFIAGEETKKISSEKLQTMGLEIQAGGGNSSRFYRRLQTGWNSGLNRDRNLYITFAVNKHS